MDHTYETKLSSISPDGGINNHVGLVVNEDDKGATNSRKSTQHSEVVDMKSHGFIKNSFDSRVSTALKHCQDTQKNQRSFNLKVYKRLLSYPLKQWGYVLAANIFLVLGSVASMAIPYFSGQIIDAMSSPNITGEEDSEAKSRLQRIAFTVLGISICSAFFALLRSYSFGIISERVIRQLRLDLFEAIVEKDIEFFDSQRSGELLSRLSSDIDRAQDASADNLSTLLMNIITCTGSLGLLFTISWKLTLVLICIVPPALVSIFAFAYCNKTIQKNYQDAIATTNNVAAEAFGNIRVVKAFSTEGKEKEFYTQRLGKSYLLGRRKSMVSGVFTGFLNLISLSGVVGIIWYGGNLVLNKELSTGGLSSFMLYSLTLSGSIVSMGLTSERIAVGIGACEKIFSIIDHKAKIVNGVGEKSNNFQGQIELRQVDFSYAGKPEVKVLDDLSLTIEPGDVVAFVGASGSGKTSLISVIERFYDVNNGGVYIDGTNVRDIDLKSYHDNIGYVSQEPSLFSGTIEENIAYGVEDYSQVQLEQALNMANAAEFIYNKSMFPEGLKTVVGERGIKLSGGQKQRVAIARALIRRPKILILDEATSALDAESEHLVQQAIDALIKDRSQTVIIIAHRLSTIISCQRIMVLKDGKIAEEGDHNTLVARGGIYKALIERQLAGYQI